MNALLCHITASELQFVSDLYSIQTANSPQMGQEIAEYSQRLNLHNDPNYIRDLVNTASADGKTALYYAVECELYDIAKLLLEKGADPCITVSFVFVAIVSLS